MKVRKMIDMLQKMPLDAEVHMHNIVGAPVLFVLAVNGDDTSVWLCDEHDCDMRNELIERFQYAANNNLDELEFYSDLVDTGIKTEMIRKYLDDESASHFDTYCKDHGLI